jgi:hypothetical protein
LRPQIIVGVVIVVVVLAAGFLAPRLRSTASKQAAQAAEQAELARRELHRYAESYALPHLERQADLDALKEADFDQLLEQSQEAFAKLGQELAQTVSQAQASDRRLGREATDLRALRSNAGDVRSAITGFDQLYQQHQALFQRAAQHARQAGQAGRDVLGVAHILGMAEFLRATRLLEDAQVQRGQLRDEQAELLNLAANWKLTQAEADHYAGLDVGEILADLQQDSEELTARKDEAAAQAEGLTRAVAERKQELAQVREQLEAGRAALLSLEEKGFQAGDDSSFNAYRERYREVADQLLTLQEQEQLLAKGGTRGGELVGDDLQTAEIQGGEVVEGLEELERKLAVAQEKAQRFVDAEQRLAERVEFVKQSGQTAQGEQARYQARLDELGPRLDEKRTRAAELAEAAYAREEEALQAAQAAVRAFQDSQAAVNTWKRAASDLQRAKDRDRKNERLRMIAGDTFVEQLVAGAKGAAKMLVARIHAQRVDALSAHLTVLERYAAVRPGEAVEREPLQTAIEAAREQAVSTLNECVQIYAGLPKDKVPWLAQSSLAVAHYMLSRLAVSPAQANEEMSLAVDSIQEAITNENFPYLTMQVRFREHLRAQGAQFGPAEQPEEEAAPEDEPAPPADGG